MSAIVFMLRKSLKNAILEMLHHPLKLIVYLFVGGMIIFGGLSAMSAPSEEDVLLDTRILEGVYLGILLLVTIPTLLMGLRSGTTLFSMSDVCMMFVSPISPKKILLYGIVKQMGMSLLIMVCFLAYGGMAVTLFGIEPWQAVLLLAGVAVMLLLAQLLTILVYSFVNGNETRIRIAKTCVFLAVAFVIVSVGLHLYQYGMSMDSALEAVSLPVVSYLPFIGWMKGLLFAILYGQQAQILLFSVLLAAGVAICAILFLRSNADYYEDVLQNTESTYEMRKAAKEGRITDKNLSRRNIRVRDTGLGKGWGANAFFYKQMREIKRRSRLAFVNSNTFVLLALALFVGVILNQNAGDDGMSPSLRMMMILMMGVYITFFTNAAGEWSRELMSPYLYLVPEPPLKKLVWASLTSLIKPLIDGLLVYTACGLLLQATPTVIIVCILTFTSFGAIFTSSNLLSQRVFGQMANKGLILMLYMFLLLLIVAPGLIVGLILLMVFDLPGVMMGIPVILWNFIASAGIYLICKTTLHDMETL